MSTLETGYQAVLVVGRHTIDVSERATSFDERILELKIDDVSKGVLSLLRHYLPRVAAGSSDVAVWAGAELYLARWEGGPLLHFSLDDDIHAAYAMGGRWCLVCEIAVLVFDPSEGKAIAI